ncbi:MAG: calcium/sodium antiporter [Xanthomonadales bacterium]|nr:calcium/sodium antiporter [Gammaproteobacteria bacterium]MBT8063889.1 calcium/sodium antiporter [Gammaproteobacteria bacterium]NNJ65556.1 calcium/sodium antiporter [Xanthomonadales bacterium]NNK32368.1 calcium/sodium antiporter [Xanthomonadales bacterium]NNK37713.1 calcium/sodium antiporter [Xanthomonadales bacterium]
MLIAISQLIGGFILLVWGADRLVAGASALARNLGVSPLVIGLTIIAFGTSAPELVVSGVAAHRGNPGLAVGNAIGSNIANIGLILGLTAIFYPLRVESETLKREYPLLMLIMIGSLIMASDLIYDRTEGWLLLFGLVALVIWMIQFGLRRGQDDPLAEEFAAEIPIDMPTGYAVLWLVVGLIILPMSSMFLVEGAVFVARSLEVSETVIGLTIMAFGTSLPELAAALTSALRHEDDLAIGNVIGSNMFNILGVLGIAAVIEPVEVEFLMLKQDFPVMFLFTMLLFFMAYGINGPGRISRKSGVLLLSLFLGYQVLVWITATRVPALPGS